MGFIGDDTGEHISLKNKDYCELTGAYWAYKNIQCDIIGICHYRRFFGDINGNILNKGDVEKELMENDLIACQNYHENRTIFSYFNTKQLEDLFKVREVIDEIYPEYIKSFDWNSTNNSMFLGNMLITKKVIYDSYCQWLFDIFFKAEQRIDIERYDMPSRLYGYLSEWLFGVWLTMQEFKIKQYPIYVTQSKALIDGGMG